MQRFGQFDEQPPLTRAAFGWFVKNWKIGLIAKIPSDVRFFCFNI